mgnify:CR=1 FL=1
MLGWLLGQSVGLVVALLWVRSLIRQLRETRAELKTSHERNALLSDCFVRSKESASLELSKQRDRHVFQLDSTLRSVNDSYTRVLASLLTTPIRSAKRLKPETQR